MVPQPAHASARLGRCRSGAAAAAHCPPTAAVTGVKAMQLPMATHGAHSKLSLPTEDMLQLHKHTATRLVAHLGVGAALC